MNISFYEFTRFVVDERITGERCRPIKSVDVIA